MIGEDLQKFSESRVMRTIAIGRVPIRNLPKNKPKAGIWKFVIKRLDLKEYFHVLGKVSDNICWKKKWSRAYENMDPKASRDLTSLRPGYLNIQDCPCNAEPCS
ncbi:hypothetical protein AVEN_116661-1 [Araneus ventricosus]|uniref:Uncharacterized protein n=1 Tax=Araneus ventricosus TaxID=182803 RepID=A0A4Y2TVS1_ARAVE|nr:hypothetical protein AVEN_116661-1 [Araneus ventricosus]